MTKLHVDYQGFKLGVRVAEQMSLFLDTKTADDVQILHKMKNMAGVMLTMREYQAFSVNGVVYAE